MDGLNRASITFFVPCLNEEGNVGRTLDTIVEVMRTRSNPYEILIVDDASADGSVTEIRERQRRYPDVRLSLFQNRFVRGLGRNYFIAAHRACGEYFMLVNGDAAEPAESIRTILDHLGEADAVVPYFGLRESRTLPRRLLSGVFTTLISLLSGHRLRYYNGPVLHRTENVRLWLSETAGFGYQAELLCRLLDERISVVEVQIANSDRNRGFSKAFTLGNLLSVMNTCFHIFLRRLERRTLTLLPHETSILPRAARTFPPNAPQADAPHRSTLQRSEPASFKGACRGNETVEQPPRLKEGGTMAFYWRTAIRSYPRQAIALLLLMVGGAVLEAATVGLTVPLLDVLTAPERIPQSRAVAIVAAAVQRAGIMLSPPTIVFTLLVVASVAFIVRSVFGLLAQYATAAIAVKLRRSAKAALFERFLSARYGEMAHRARGVVVNDINQPAESLAGAITQLGYLVTGLLTSLLMVSLLLYLSWWATLLIGALAIGAVQGWRLYADHRSAIHGRTLYDLRGSQNKLQVDAIDGLKVVKACGLERRMVERQDALLAAEYRPELQLVVFRHGPMVVNEAIAAVIVLILGAMTFLFPAFGFRFSTLAAFLFAIRRIAPSLATINQASVSLNKYKRNLEVIDEVLRTLPQERRGGQVTGRMERVQLHQVVFAYDTRPEVKVLDGISATMRRGTITAIVGSTGSGKSTLVHLLLGFYEPRTGAVLIDGVDLRRVDLAAWRRAIGYVSQDLFVFNATIAENIALGDDFTPSQIEWAARIAQLHDFVAALPDGYETEIGDRGLRLSGGQCQRLAIARAVVRRPAVLIFDEATSALDNLTERAVYEAIRSLQREAIVIVVAHRLTTVKDADQILVLEAGCLVEQGVHDELLRQHGVYARLYVEDGRGGAEAAPSGNLVPSGETR